jgi:hypothetical protein
MPYEKLAFLVLSRLFAWGDWGDVVGVFLNN